MIKSVIQELSNVGYNIPDRSLNFKIKNADKIFRYVFNYFVPNYTHIPEYDLIIKWLENNNGKGLAMLGASGRGKSVILQKVLPVIFLKKLNRIIKPVQAYDLKEVISGRIVVIDEIGNESVVNNFGNKKELIPLIIDKSEINKSILIISGNITGEDFISRYGKPIFDRLVNNCEVVNFSGKSFRII